MFSMFIYQNLQFQFSNQNYSMRKYVFQFHFFPIGEDYENGVQKEGGKSGLLFEVIKV